MSTGRRRNRLARSAFLSLGLLLAAVAAVMPAWGEALRGAGGYAGYTDLELALDPPADILAGLTEPLGLAVTNHGPDPVSTPWVLLSADPGLVIYGADCSVLGTGSLRCFLPPLGVGESHLASATIASSPEARGVRAIAGYAGSELPTGGLGLELDAGAIELYGITDMGASVFDELPETLPDGRLRWTFFMDNLGPSSQLAADFRVDVVADPPVALDVTCHPSPQAVCSSAPFAYDGFIPPGGDLQVDVTTALPHGGSVEAIDVYFQIFSLGDENLSVRPQLVHVRRTASMFRDGFEGF